MKPCLAASASRPAADPLGEGFPEWCSGSRGAEARFLGSRGGVLARPGAHGQAGSWLRRERTRQFAACGLVAGGESDKLLHWGRTSQGRASSWEDHDHKAIIHFNIVLASMRLAPPHCAVQESQESQPHRAAAHTCYCNLAPRRRPQLATDSQLHDRKLPAQILKACLANAGRSQRLPCYTCLCC